MKSRPKGRRADRVRRYTDKSGTVREYRYPAKAAQPSPRSGDDLAGLLVAWQRSPEWRKLAEPTKQHYAHYLKPLAKMGQASVSDLKRQHLLEIRDSLALARGDGAATGFIRAVSALLTWARERGIVEHNPILGGTKGLERGSLRAWTAEEAETAMERLPEPLRRVVVLALFTAQRRGDLCAMRWSQYDGLAIRLVQGKTGASVVIPCHPQLNAELGVWALNRTALTILTDRAGRPWKPNLLSHYLPDALVRIGLSNELNVHGLRKLACTMLAEAGASTHEIAAISGHRSLQMVAYYTRAVDQEKLAQSAMARLDQKWKRRDG